MGLSVFCQARWIEQRAKQARKEHPFGEDEGDAAAKYLAKHTYSTVAEAETVAPSGKVIPGTSGRCAYCGKSIRYECWVLRASPHMRPPKESVASTNTTMM
jgi:hypothetical protein